MADFSDNALMITFKVEGDSLTMTCPTGQSYSAKLDGTDAPYKGDPGIDGVSVLRLGEHAIMETDKRGAKRVREVHVMMGPGSSRTIDVIMSDMVRDTGVVYVADKQ